MKKTDRAKKNIIGSRSKTGTNNKVTVIKRQGLWLQINLSYPNWIAFFISKSIPGFHFLIATMIAMEKFSDKNADRFFMCNRG